jgi:hypothetical protein
VFTGSSLNIFVSVWDGSTWTPTLDIADAGNQSGVAVAYESISGRAMLVYGNKADKANLVYRIWDGSTCGDEQVAFSLLGNTRAANLLCCDLILCPIVSLLVESLALAVLCTVSRMEVSGRQQRRDPAIFKTLTFLPYRLPLRASLGTPSLRLARKVQQMCTTRL